MIKRIIKIPFYFAIGSAAIVISAFIGLINIIKK